MKSKKKIILIIIFSMLLLAGLLWIVNSSVPKRQNRENAETKPTEIILGGDRDEHGCIGSAGYSWCGAKRKCLRIWEEPCEEE